MVLPPTPFCSAISSFPMDMSKEAMRASKIASEKHSACSHFPDLTVDRLSNLVLFLSECAVQKEISTLLEDDIRKTVKSPHGWFLRNLQSTLQSMQRKRKYFVAIRSASRSFNSPVNQRLYLRDFVRCQTSISDEKFSENLAQSKVY